MNIKHIREKANISQDDLSKTLNVDRSTISKWETGVASPHTSKLPQIADALGCNIEDLFEGNNQKNVI